MTKTTFAAKAKLMSRRVRVFPQNDPDETKPGTGHEQVFASIMPDQWADYLSFNRFYFTHFGYVPEVIELQGINCKQAADWLFENYQDEIHQKHSYTTYRPGGKLRSVEWFVFLLKDAMLRFDDDNEKVFCLYLKTDPEAIESLRTGLGKFPVRDDSKVGKIKVLSRDGGRVDLVDLQVSKPKLRIRDNYNDDFLPLHKIIMKRLRKKNDKGIVLLHGKPGTGKTSYIRYLICSVRKQVIFLPPNMASALTGPDFINLLMENPNSILVIEDAESVIVDRERANGSPVSSLLNLSDGLLSDCMNIQVICTFNTDLTKVDDALLRKGRLIARYEFGKLKPEKANALAAKLKQNRKFTEDVLLTEVHNPAGEHNISKSGSQPNIGFVKA